MAFRGATAALLLFVATAPACRAQEALPKALVHLRSVDETILQDIRYATPKNFTGSPVPGYQAAECIVTRGVAAALARIQARLKAEAISLLVYDCYRPKHAVSAFVRWVERLDAVDRETAWFHPNVARRQLITLGYIAATSGHSRGDTVDLTLVRLPEHESARGASVSGADCTAPVRSEPPGAVDMGTAFDCFDVKSHTAASGITSQQRQWREKLLRVMQAEGFRNYAREWWHFTLGAGDGPSYDFPVRPIASR